MTDQFLVKENKSRIAYTLDKRSDKMGVLYLHGLLSSRHTPKAAVVEEFAQKNGYSFLSLDYTSHGQSDGAMTDFRIGQCLSDIENVVEHCLPNVPLLVVGSSLGGWLSLLLAQKRPSQILGILGIAPGVDFTKRVWNDMLTDEMKRIIREKGVLGPSDETNGYCLTYDLFQEAQQHYLLDRKINYDGVVLLIQGDCDPLVPYQTVFQIKDQLTSDTVSVYLIKGGGHHFRGERELTLIQELLSILDREVKHE